MAEILSTLSVISFIVAGVCLVLAIFFWFFFSIPTVIGDLSGRTARKSIARMRAANEKTGSKAYKASKTNAERGKLTGTMPDSEKLSKKKADSDDSRPETGLLSENKAINPGSDETELLAGDETVMLEAETTGLLIDEDATAPLNIPSQKPVKRVGGKKLTMLDDVMLIHTEEVIG